MNTACFQLFVAKPHKNNAVFYFIFLIMFQGNNCCRTCTLCWKDLAGISALADYPVVTLEQSGASEGERNYPGTEYFSS
jgi:hypothetical protein